MPRGARLDTPGILHHIIVRGIDAAQRYIKKGDAPLLGSSEFVNPVIDEADRYVKYQLADEEPIGAARSIIRSGYTEHQVSIKLLRSGNRRQAVSNLRKQLTLKLVNELGLSLAETGRQLGLTTSGVAWILRRNQSVQLVMSPNHYWLNGK